MRHIAADDGRVQHGARALGSSLCPPPAWPSRAGARSPPRRCLGVRRFVRGRSKRVRWRVIGDIYDPGTGGRLQIRDKHRRIIGYIEGDGDVTNQRRCQAG